MADNESHVCLILEKLREVGIDAKLEGESMVKCAKKIVTHVVTITFMA
jgi:hypothetical protein